MKSSPPFRGIAERINAEAMVGKRGEKKESPKTDGGCKTAGNLWLGWHTRKSGSAQVEVD